MEEKKPATSLLVFLRNRLKSWQVSGKRNTSREKAIFQQYYNLCIADVRSCLCQIEVNKFRLCSMCLLISLLLFQGAIKGCLPNNASGRCTKADLTQGMLKYWCFRRSNLIDLIEVFNDKLQEQYS